MVDRCVLAALATIAIGAGSASMSPAAVGAPPDGASPGSPARAGLPGVRVLIGPIDRATLLSSGRVSVRLHSRRRQRIGVAVLFYPTQGPGVNLGPSQGITLAAGRTGEINAPLGPSARALVQGCSAGRVVVRLRGRGGRGAPAASSPLGLEPPDCGRFFSPTSFWNTPVPTDTPLDPDSAGVTAELLRHVAAGPAPTINTSAYAPPVYTVGLSQPPVRVTLDQPPGENPDLASAFAAAPLPHNAQPAAGSDAELVVWQPATDTLWEFWLLRRAADGWHARWGGRLDHVSTGPGLYAAPHDNWGTSASSLPLVGGLLTPRELGGEIDHVLSIAVPGVRAFAFSRPAARTDGSDVCPHAVPEGAHFRLDPTLNIAGLGLAPPVAALARAAQRYGIVVRDQGASVAFYAQNSAPLPTDPYPAILGSAGPAALLASFPWSHLQLLRMDLVAPMGASTLPGTLQLLGLCP